MEMNKLVLLRWIMLNLYRFIKLNQQQFRHLEIFSSSKLAAMTRISF